MSHPPSSLDHVTRCIEELLDALCEAHDLARSNRFDSQFAETMRYANELVERVNASVADDSPAAPLVDEVRDRLNAVSALFPSSQTVH